MKNGLVIPDSGPIFSLALIDTLNRIKLRLVAVSKS